MNTTKTFRDQFKALISQIKNSNDSVVIEIISYRQKNIAFQGSLINIILGNKMQRSEPLHIVARIIC